jgi:hypothetical protein
MFIMKLVLLMGKQRQKQNSLKILQRLNVKKQKLIETEKASFQGSSGVGAAGLSTTYLRKGSSAGQF